MNADSLKSSLGKFKFSEIIIKNISSDSPSLSKIYWHNKSEEKELNFLSFKEIKMKNSQITERKIRLNLKPGQLIWVIDCLLISYLKQIEGKDNEKENYEIIFFLLLKWNSLSTSTTATELETTTPTSTTTLQTILHCSFNGTAKCKDGTSCCQIDDGEEQNLQRKRNKQHLLFWNFN